MNHVHGLEVATPYDDHMGRQEGTLGEERVTVVLKPFCNQCEPLLQCLPLRITVEEPRLELRRHGLESCLLCLLARSLK